MQAHHELAEAVEELPVQQSAALVEVVLEELVDPLRAQQGAQPLESYLACLQSDTPPPPPPLQATLTWGGMCY